MGCHPPAFLIPLLAVVAAPACDGGPTCYVPPTITVFDARNGKPICDATITASAGGPSVDLSASRPEFDGGQLVACQYDPEPITRDLGLTWTLTVARSGYKTAVVVGVVVPVDEHCDTTRPPPRRVVVALEPLP